jgi:hypothetical protein
VLRAFVKAGQLKVASSLDHGDTLLTKFRTQLRNRKVPVDRLYSEMDQSRLGKVTRDEFFMVAHHYQLNFSDEEMEKLFTAICEQGTQKTQSRDMQVQQEDAAAATAYQRFDYKQLQAAVSA